MRFDQTERKTMCRQFSSSKNSNKSNRSPVIAIPYLHLHSQQALTLRLVVLSAWRFLGDLKVSTSFHGTPEAFLEYRALTSSEVVGDRTLPRNRHHLELEEGCDDEAGQVMVGSHDLRHSRRDHRDTLADHGRSCVGVDSRLVAGSLLLAYRNRQLGEGGHVRLSVGKSGHHSGHRSDGGESARDKHHDIRESSMDAPVAGRDDRRNRVEVEHRSRRGDRVVETLSAHSDRLWDVLVVSEMYIRICFERVL